MSCSKPNKLLVGLVLGLLAGTAVAAPVYRCHDPHLDTTIYQDKPCALQGYSVAQEPEHIQHVVKHTADIAPQAPIQTSAAVVPKQQTEKSYPTKVAPIPVAAIVAPFYRVAGFLFFFSIIGAWVLHGRQKYRPHTAEPAWRRSTIKPVDSNSKPVVLPFAPSAKEWSLPLLQSIEWKRFEDLCAAYYQAKGIRSATTALGPDGGIDIRLYQAADERASTIVQCKAWPENKVGVKLIRELLGVRVAEKADKAFFMTCGSYTDDAQTFAGANGITLFTGDMFLMMLKRLPEAERQRLLAFATEGDYTTPTCPQCGQKLVARESQRGKFWGCRSYPRCKGKLGMRGV